MATKEPLQLAPEVDTSQILLVIVYLVLIIVGAYFLTQYVAKRRMQQGMRRSRPSPTGGTSAPRSMWRSDNHHMVYVVDRIPIDREKTLMVVEFEGKYYFIGTTAQDFKLFDRVPMPQEDIIEQQKAEEQAAEEQAQSAENPVTSLQTAEDDTETFGQRFRRAFAIVLRSYLPAGMRKSKSSSASFDEELKARMRRRSGTQNNEDPKD